jgi:anti-sigma regulatory factor (Ser/Thr protein kinase)
MAVQSRIRLPRDLDEVTSFRHDLDVKLDDLGVAERRRADLGLAFSEVCTNVITHLTPGEQFEIAVSADQDECVIEVSGFGDDRPAADANLLTESARDLQIVNQIATDVQISDGLVRRVTIAYADKVPS